MDRTKRQGNSCGGPSTPLPRTRSRISRRLFSRPLSCGSSSGATRAPRRGGVHCRLRWGWCNMPLSRQSWPFKPSEEVDSFVFLLDFIYLSQTRQSLLLHIDLNVLHCNTRSRTDLEVVLCYMLWSFFRTSRRGWLLRRSFDLNDSVLKESVSWISALVCQSFILLFGLVFCSKSTCRHIDRSKPPFGLNHFRYVSAP